MADPIFLFFRRLYVLQLGLSIYLSYKIAQVWWNTFATKEQKEDVQATDKVWDGVHERNAKKAYHAIVGLQGLWIKAGQYISTRADVIPESYVRLLKTLQDQVPSKPVDVTVATICSEFQIDSLDEVFEEFDVVPLATASIAQVHKAILKPKSGTNGYPVQHANIQKRVIQDLQDLRIIMRLIGYFEPNYDFTPIVEEWSNEVPKELDFIIEARNTMEIRDAIAEHNKDGKYELAHPLHVDCGFADPIPSLVTEKMDIKSWTAKPRQRKCGHGRYRYQRHKSLRFPIYVLGFWNSDPHPGNFLVAKKVDSDKFIPYTLDFGLTKRATRQEVIALSRILLSAQNMDLAGLMSGLQEIGIGAAAEVDPERSMDVIQFIFRKTGSIEESKAEMQERRKKQEELDKEDKEKKKAEEKAAKKDGPVAKKPSMLFLACLSSFLETLRLPRHSASSCGVPKWKVGGRYCCWSFGMYDPRPVETDSLFPVFSCSKAIAAAACHLMIQRGKLKLTDTVSSHWPEFVSSVDDPIVRQVKSRITVADLLSHRAGLADAAPINSNKATRDGDSKANNPTRRNNIVSLFVVWLACWGLVQKVAGKPFGEVVREMLDEMGVGGYGYVGIPPGVEARLASLHWDASELRTLIASQFGMGAGLKSGGAFTDEASTDIMGLLNEFTGDGSLISSGGSSGIIGQVQAAMASNRQAGAQEMASRLRNVRLNPMLSNPTFFNDLRIRRSVIPAASAPSSPRKKAFRKRPSAASIASTTNAASTSVEPRSSTAPLIPHSPITEPLAPFKSVFEPHTITAMQTVFPSPHASPSNALQFTPGFHRYRFDCPVQTSPTTVVSAPSPSDPTLTAHKPMMKTTYAFGHSGLGGSFAFAHRDSGVVIAVVISKISLVETKVGREIVECVARELGIGEVVGFGRESRGEVKDVTMNPFG
ncbi:hypothetical protein BC829DRAFT_412582 [Chytridium lagenaria]|nr:hypothetical protein BC829DRAFT_412582 [Chytridium lagenaria]